MWRRLFVAAIAACSTLTCQAAQDSSEYAQKFTIRAANGALVNLGSAGGSSINFGGLNLLYLRSLDAKVSWGIGFHMAFDFSNSHVPIHGIDLDSRFYFLGQSSRRKFTTDEISGSIRDGWAGYVQTELSQQTYYLGSNPTAMPGQDQTGNFYNVSLGVGCDYRLNAKWELNAEGDLSLLTFAATDDRVRISTNLFKIGLSYLW